MFLWIAKEQTYFNEVSFTPCLCNRKISLTNLTTNEENASEGFVISAILGSVSVTLLAFKFKIVEPPNETSMTRLGSKLCDHPHELNKDKIIKASP